MKQLVLFLSLSMLLALFLETTLAQFPLVLILLLVFAVIYQKEWVFFIGFVAGLILDNLLFRSLGATSLFFLVFLLMVFLYKQKYEIQTIPFVGIMSGIGSLVYFWLFGATIVWVQTFICIVVGIILFLLYSRYALWRKHT